MLSYGARWPLSLMSRELRNPLARSIPVTHRSLKGDAAAPKRTVQSLAGQHVRGQVRRNGCNGLIDRRECRLLRSLLEAKPTSGRAHETT